jgi:hypothetical protein
MTFNIILPLSRKGIGNKTKVKDDLTKESGFVIEAGE